MSHPYPSFEDGISPFITTAKTSSGHPVDFRRATALMDPDLLKQAFARFGSSGPWPADPCVPPDYLSRVWGYYCHLHFRQFGWPFTPDSLPRWYEPGLTVGLIDLEAGGSCPFSSPARASASSPPTTHLVGALPMTAEVDPHASTGMSNQLSDVMAAASARIGEVKEYKRQKYICVAVTPYTRRDGAPSAILVWESRCKRCDEVFAITTANSEKFQPNRRCQIHRRRFGPGASAAPQRRAGGLSRPDPTGIVPLLDDELLDQ